MKIFRCIPQHPALIRLVWFGLIYIASLVVFAIVIFGLQLLVPH